MDTQNFFERKKNVSIVSMSCIKIIMGILIFTVMIWGALLLFTTYKGKDDSVIAEKPFQVQPITEQVFIPSVFPVNTQILITPPIGKDTDGDGLFDEEEILLGTDIFSKDTDGDGLSDFEEVKIYGTNPLLYDTDADGFSDGVEIRSGYNPKGEGPLRDLQRVLSN